jgi:hypothetical protein
MREVEIELGFEPFAHQLSAFRLTLAHRFLVLVWHRRAGKTVFAIMLLIRAALTCKLQRGRYAYVAPLLKQAKKAVWDYLKAYTKPITGCKYNESELSIEFPNGSKIWLFGADDPDSLRSLYYDGVVLDEVAQMRPQVWGQIIRPALADRKGWALFIGTPHGLNLFSDLYYDAVKGKQDWAHDLRRPQDTNVIDAAELAALKAEMTPQEYAQEFDCDFSAAVTNALLPLDIVLAAQERTLAPPAYTPYPKILGVDIARQGGDRSVFAPRQGPLAFRPHVHRIENLMELADAVAATATRWGADAIFLDQGGMGYGVLDRLGKLGYPVTGVDFGSRALRPDLYENRRAEMWWEMANWVKGGACLPNDPALRADLTTPEYDYRNKRDRLALESKHHMRERGRQSPDIGDALALTFAVPVPMLTEFERQRGGRLGLANGGERIRREDDLRRDA